MLCAKSLMKLDKSPHRDP